MPKIEELWARIGLIVGCFGAIVLVAVLFIVNIR
jgi:hypothetical protein